MEKFEIGFWHPFGPHGEETAGEILTRKREEISENGWTLWSFQHRTKDTLQSWCREIEAKKPSSVFVFCSDSKGTRAPAGETKYCEYYLPVDASEPIEIPLKIKVPHPMGGRAETGSAFIVKDIIYPVKHEPIEIEWLYGSKNWRHDRMPTRGEYLIKPGHGEPMRRFLAILELQAPYVVKVGIDPSSSLRA